MAFYLGRHDLPRDARLILARLTWARLLLELRWQLPLTAPSATFFGLPHTSRYSP